MYEKVTAYILENREKFYRLAFSYVHEREAALDIVQNAICKALEKYHTIRSESGISSWFYRVLVNESYSHIKKHKREIAVGDEAMPEEVYIEKALEPGEELYKKVDKLPEHLKTVIILRFYEDMSLEEISKATNTNLNTVKTRLYTALKRLKKFVMEVY